MTPAEWILGGIAFALVWKVGNLEDRIRALEKRLFVDKVKS